MWFFKVCGLYWPAHDARMVRASNQMRMSNEQSNLRKKNQGKKQLQSPQQKKAYWINKCYARINYTIPGEMPEMSKKKSDSSDKLNQMNISQVRTLDWIRKNNNKPANRSMAFEHINATKSK